jgi:hypothetical protein
MSKHNWPSIKSDYVETTMTLAEVQQKWGVLRGTLSARAARGNWNDEKQRFAASLEQKRRENALAAKVAAHTQFEDNVTKLANAYLVLIARQLQDSNAGVVDATKTEKLAKAFETVQRVGNTAFRR